MILVSFGACCEVIKIGQNEVKQVMEHIRHGALESSMSIIKAKRHDTVCECALGCSKCHFVLIPLLDSNLVVARETIHE